MASYVKTRFEVYGKKNDVQKFIAFISSETSDFDFNNVIPMPEEIDKDTGNVDIESLVYYCLKTGIDIDPRTCANPKLLKVPARAFCALYVTSLEQIEDRLRETGKDPEEYYRLGKQLYLNYQKYGYNYWEDWCLRNWESEWNAYYVDFNGMYLIYRAENPVNDKYAVSYKFCTICERPASVFEKIIEEFPELEFEIMTAGGSIYGVYIVRGKDGKIVENKSVTGDKAHDLIVEIWGYDPDEDEEF